MYPDQNKNGQGRIRGGLQGYPGPLFENEKMILALVSHAEEYVLADPPFIKSNPLMYEYVLPSGHHFPKRLNSPLNCGQTFSF